MYSNWSYSPETKIWVVTSVTLTFDLWPWPFAWTLPWSNVITPENFMMIRWWEHSQKGVTDRHYELIWYGRPNANKSYNYGYQQDDSTARRHLKSPWSLSGSSLHLILVTKRSRSWSWMTPDCSLSIGPPIPEIGLFQNLTLKIQCQGQIRWLHLLLRIQSTRLLFISWQLHHIWLRTWGMANFIFDWENFRSRPWPRSNLIVTFKA